MGHNSKLTRKSGYAARAHASENACFAENAKLEPRLFGGANCHRNLISFANLAYSANFISQSWHIFSNLAYSAEPFSYSASVIFDEIHLAAEYAEKICFIFAYSAGRVLQFFNFAYSATRFSLSILHKITNLVYSAR